MATYEFDDGGRAEAGFKGAARDCVARAVAIAAGLPYREVYDALARGAGAERNSRGRSARRGIHTGRRWFQEYMRSLGFVWTPTMSIGSGCRVHLDAEQLPAGRLVVSVSKHYTAVIDGVIRDTHDPRDRGTTIHSVPAEQEPRPGWRFLRHTEHGGRQYAESPPRCVYGYWRLEVLAGDGEAAAEPFRKDL